MKKIFKTISLALFVMSIYSCTSDDETVQDVNDNSYVVTTFTCTQENDGTATKAALGSGGNIFWESGDAISIFDGNKVNHNYNLETESVGKTTGTFSGTGAVTGSYVAVYPYTAGATLNNDGTVSNIVLPDEQEAVAGGFDPKAALMIATSTTTSLKFKNAVGFIKVQLAEGFDCKKIILRAANKNKPLAGKGKINFTDPEKPYIDFTGSTELTYSITLSGTITGGNAYYIAVPAGVYSANWTLTFVTENKNYMRQVTKPITFARSKALNLGTFAKDGGSWVTDQRGIVSADQEVDMGVCKIDGTNYRLIFAKSNLTATGLAAEESDFGDYFAWAATEPWLTSYTHSGSDYEDASFSDKTWKTGYKAGYAWSTVPYRDGTNNSCSKYINDKDVLAASDDAANVILGGDWQIPTRDIWKALNNSLSYTWTWTSSSKNGREVKNKSTKNSIFLPAAGYVLESSFNDVGSNGYYWSGTASSTTGAYDKNIDKYERTLASGSRYRGSSVRPVRLVAE